MAPTSKNDTAGSIFRINLASLTFVAVKTRVSLGVEGMRSMMPPLSQEIERTIKDAIDDAYAVYPGIHKAAVVLAVFWKTGHPCDLVSSVLEGYHRDAGSEHWGAERRAAAEFERE